MAISHISILVLFLFLCLSPPSFSYSERWCHPNDKKALLQIKKDLNNPYDLISWKPKTDCCSEWLGVYCNEINRTKKLDLTQSHLQVPIPAAVADLPYLQSLTFQNTKVTGEIPVAISKLSSLVFLDLRWNLLTGPVPGFLIHLKKLSYIGLSFNSLTGSIPASLSHLPELNNLLLDGNKLTGSIPESFADFKQQDFYLYLSRNRLSGPIPRKLSSASFARIDVSRNRLEGDLSFLFGKDKTSLNTVDFSRNLFEFDFSKLEFPKTLENIDLKHNKIYGSIPEGLAKLGDLITLNVSYNRLCGKIPVGGMLQQYDYTVYFHNKCLCGSPLPKLCN